MRRNLCLLVLTALLSLWMTNASAQLRLGVKGGYNYTKWSFGKLKVNKEDKNGFFIGPTLKVSLPTKSSIGFSLNVSGLYDQRKVQVGDTDPVEVTSKMVAVPVNLQLDLLRGSSIELFAYAGPEFDFSLKNDDKILEAAKTWKFRESGFSLNAGAGILLMSFLQLSVNYNLVCRSTNEVTMETITDDVKSFKTKANTGHVALTIYF